MDKKDQLIKKILEEDTKPKKKLGFMRVGVYLFFILTLVGLLISFIFLRDITISGNLIGIKEGNLYGLMVILIFFIVWTFLMVEWFKRSNKDD
ncbi:MAG: hypothetical protein WC867_00805 [Candidatus Pacearchaeota archaeon]